MSDERAGWLLAVRSALDEAPSGWLDWFFRDDDAGWADPALWELARLFEDAGISLEVAAIPDEISRETAAGLRAAVSAGVIRVYQHGRAHLDHEAGGRKCEFGPGRGLAEQAADLAGGRDWLGGLLWGQVEPVFVPPWNRCSDLTIGLLAELGFAGLSRDMPGSLRHVPDPAGLALGEVGVCADWSRLWREGGAELLGRELAGAIRRRLAPGGTHGTLGVMLHHATLSPDQLLALRDLLDLVGRHPAVRFVPLTELVDQASESGVPAAGVTAIGRSG